MESTVSAPGRVHTIAMHTPAVLSVDKSEWRKDLDDVPNFRLDLQDPILYQHAAIQLVTAYFYAATR